MFLLLSHAFSRPLIAHELINISDVNGHIVGAKSECEHHCTEDLVSTENCLYLQFLPIWWSWIGDWKHRFCVIAMYTYRCSCCLVVLELSGRLSGGLGREGDEGGDNVEHGVFEALRLRHPRPRCRASTNLFLRHHWVSELFAPRRNRQWLP